MVWAPPSGHCPVQWGHEALRGLQEVHKGVLASEGARWRWWHWKGAQRPGGACTAAAGCQHPWEASRAAQGDATGAGQAERPPVALAHPSPPTRGESHSSGPKALRSPCPEGFPRAGEQGSPKSSLCPPWEWLRTGSCQVIDGPHTCQGDREEVAASTSPGERGVPSESGVPAPQGSLQGSVTHKMASLANLCGVQSSGSLGHTGGTALGHT